MDFEKELSEIYPWILKVARKFCCSMQDAEDLAGDTVYKLLVNRDKFDCSKPLQPWCLIIMRNTYIIRYNRNSLIHFTGLDMVDGSAISNCTAHSILFDDLVSIIQRCAKKSRCIDSVMYYAVGSFCYMKLDIDDRLKVYGNNFFHKYSKIVIFLFGGL